MSKRECVGGDETVMDGENEEVPVVERERGTEGASSRSKHAWP